MAIISMHAWRARFIATMLPAVIGIVLWCAWGTAHATDAPDIAQRIVVLDVELVGDLSDLHAEADHAARLIAVSEQLRAELSGRGGYAVVDTTPVHDRIAALRALQYLHKCNGCEIDVAAALNADLVLVSWIHRVSALILTLNYEVRSVPEGITLRRKAFDFRGDNDRSWSRAISYMVRDLAMQ